MSAALQRSSGAELGTIRAELGIARAELGTGRAPRCKGRLALETAAARGSYRPRPTRLSTATGQAIRRSRIEACSRRLDFLFPPARGTRVVGAGTILEIETFVA